MTLTAESLAQAMGDTLSLARYRELLPAMNAGMLAAQCTTPKRAAAWCSQIGHESVGLKYMAEIEKSNPTWNADRTRYRGRGPIQLTWSSNYRKFGQWCVTNGYVTDQELFVKQPEFVEQPKWGFLAASWYWLNAGPRPGQINGFADRGDILAVSRCINGWIETKQPNGMPDRQARWDRCLAMGDSIIPDPTGAQPMPDNRPDFNEINEIGLDNGNHASVRSRPPINFFLHTQEGDGNATDLSAYLRSTSGSSAVSYHYTINQSADGGVTVVDVVDTDLYSWSVLNANVFSINLCFAGSRAAWTRDQWMKQSKAIRVAAYLAVQDAKKYGFSTEVILPPYGTARAGMADHRYVTKCLGIGNHTDVGGPLAAPWSGFPWDYFVQCVNEFTDNAPVVTQPAPVTPVPASTWPKNATDRELMEWLVNQMGVGDASWPSKGMTLRDRVFSLAKADA